MGNFGLSLARASKELYRFVLFYASGGIKVCGCFSKPPLHEAARYRSEAAVGERLCLGSLDAWGGMDLLVLLPSSPRRGRKVVLLDFA